MKFLVVLSFVFLGFSAQSQHEFQVWTELGASGKVTKDLKWSVDLCSRFGGAGLETFFPEIGLEYKVKKWFSPSIDYRLVMDKDKYGNYSAGNRLNLNANFKERFGRFDMSARLRYQYAFSRSSGAVGSDIEFDQAFRLKAGGSYDINNSIIAPAFSAEFFFNPQYGPERGYSKLRAAVGLDFELDGPHKFSVKYQLDVDADKSKNKRSVIALSYGYKFGSKKKDKKEVIDED